MTEQERATRRVKIVRRWVAYRVSRAQREIWKKKRRGRPANSLEEEEDLDPVEGADTPSFTSLADLTDELLG